MFAAGAMLGEQIDLAEMKIKKLSAELELRNATKTGRKGTLQQWLHALLIKAKVAEWRAGGHFDDEAEREGKGQERGGRGG